MMNNPVSAVTCLKSFAHCAVLVKEMCIRDSGSTLEIVSEVGKGTDISFTVSLADNSEESEDFEDEI